MPVLIGGTMFGEATDNGVGFVLDLTPLKRAEAESREHERRYREALMELAHANRITTIGQPTASIAHEVNQPFAAAVTNAQAALRWHNMQIHLVYPEEVRQALDRIVKAGRRAGDVISRMRALVRRHPRCRTAGHQRYDPRSHRADGQRTALSSGTSLQTQLADGLPLVPEDPIQLQQVLLNLILNAVDAMSRIWKRGRASC